MPKKSASSVRGARAARKRKPTRRRIDFSEIPESNAIQLRSMRVGRPPLGDGARQLIAIRLDAKVLRALRSEANRRSLGYQTLVNEVLADYVRKRAS